MISGNINFKDCAALIESNPDGVIVLDMKGQPWIWNQRYLAIWGLTDEQISRFTLDELTDTVLAQIDEPELSKERFLVRVLDAHLGEKVHFRTRGGRWLRRRAHDFIVDDVKQGVVVHWNDVTETYELRREAAYEHDLLLALIDNIPDQVYFKDHQSRFIRINPSLARRYGLNNPEEAIGKSDADFYSAEHAAQTAAEERRIMETAQGVYSQLHHEKWGDGRESWNLSTKLPLRGPQGDIIGTFGISHDITEHKQRESIIWQQANFDALTGLPNRRHLRARWEQAKVHAERSKSMLALMLLDLDHFKEVNDTLGHAYGDELVKEVARRLQHALRGSDVVARLGGDEFAIVLSNLYQPILAAEVAQKILSTVAEPFVLNEETVFVTASIGIALFPGDGLQLDDLFKYADQAMYHAKRLGRNRFSFYTANLEAEAQRKMRLGADLRQALYTEQLYLVYQPVVDLRDGRTVKAEVLLRWNHPVLGHVSPAEFIPIAESSGWINELGDWVLVEATRQLALWRSGALPDFGLAINKSPMQVARPADRALRLAEHLKALGLPGEAITIEITEGVLLQPTDRVRERLKEFRQAGVRLAIDDFGTGYSAMSYLLQFDIQLLKIDKIFVQGMVGDERSLALCKAVVGMAQALGMEVVAEGVETPQQRELLTQIGCNYGQGYCLGKPMTAEVFEQWMNERQG